MALGLDHFFELQDCVLLVGIQDVALDFLGVVQQVSRSPPLLSPVGKGLVDRRALDLLGLGVRLAVLFPKDALRRGRHAMLWIKVRDLHLDVPWVELGHALILQPLSSLGVLPPHVIMDHHRRPRLWRRLNLVKGRELLELAGRESKSVFERLLLWLGRGLDSLVHDERLHF